jgi:hypothetical protein
VSAIRKEIHMNKILISALFALVATTATAKTVYYPETACKEILSSEYSTGGGDSSWEMYEILCRDADGKYTTFVTSWMSVAGLFGMGRIAYEETIDLVPYNGTTLKAE